MTTYNYYYNNVPGQGLCRNNLIYTSLISEDKTVFVQWYYNDTEYHKGKNQVVDPNKMQEKWNREVKFLTLMSENFPDKVPNILDIDYNNKKIYLEIESADFWEESNCLIQNYDKVLPDWQTQMIDIVKAHKSLGIHKYSMHPSSYFIVNGKLKSINYFFAYDHSDNFFSIKDVESHIYTTRQEEMKKYISALGIDWNSPQNFDTMDKLCWNSFRTNYPKEFIEKVLAL